MNTIKTIFFGSTDDSVIVLNKISSLDIGDCVLDIVSVVTQPARPVGRDKIVTVTPVAVWAKKHDITSLTFQSNPEKPWLYQDESLVIESLSTCKADLVISACYGERIPNQVIQAAKFGGVNVHPSILPRWRGGDPVPWAILAGDHQTGVSVVTLGQSFDKGAILGQKKLPISTSDITDDLRTRLFTLGAKLLVDVIPDVMSKKHTEKSSPAGKASDTTQPYARRFSREDGFVPFELIDSALNGIDLPKISGKSGSRHAKPDPASQDSAGQFSDITIIRTTLEHSENKPIILPELIERAFRAFSPWPGIWTTIDIKGEKKRLKLLDVSLDSSDHALHIKTVQLEGKTPVSWEQFVKAYMNAE